MLINIGRGIRAFPKTRTGTIVPNLILELDNLVSYIDAQASTKLGSPIETVQALAGTDFNRKAVGSEPVYTTGVFGARGALVAPDTSTQIGYDTDFAQSTTQTFGFVVDFPADILTSTIMAVGNSSQGSTSARLMTSAGELTFGRNEATAFETLKEGIASTQSIIFLEFVSLTECNVYVDGVGITHTFNPSDNYNSGSFLRIWLFSVTNADALPDLGLGAFFHTTDVLTLVEKQSVITQWNAEFGLSVSTEVPVVLDPIAGLANIISDIDFSDSGNYVFSSGVQVSTVTANSGISLAATGSTSEYASTAFGGEGGVELGNAALALYQDTAFTATPTQTIFMVFHIPTYSKFASFFSLQAGAGATGNNAARLVHGPSEIRWAKDSGGAYVYLADTNLVGTVVMAIRGNSDSSMDIFTNSLTATDSFDPDDAFGDLTNIRLGSRTGTDGVADVQFGYLLQTSDAKTNTEVADIITFLADKFNTTI